MVYVGEDEYKNYFNSLYSLFNYNLFSPDNLEKILSQKFQKIFPHWTDFKQVRDNMTKELYLKKELTDD